MNRLMLAVLPLGLVLAGCSKGEHGEAAQEVSAPARDAAASKAEAGGKPAPGASQAATIAVTVPKIAYVYDYGYRVSAERMPALQRKHADLCEKLGPSQCRVLELRQSGAEGDYASGSLALDVAAPRARAFGAELAKAAGAAGGEEVSSGITGEDLSKKIIDTEARLRARSLLRDRLMEVLATRKGSVAELVEAERGVAQVNEEIDEARSWLAEMQGRVDFSRVNLSYSAGGPSGGAFTAPIRDALGNVGGVLGWTFAAIIMALTVLVPIGTLLLVLRAIWRRLRRTAASLQESETLPQ
ncbi:DUF4349 domain-containing protein [Novosphingobium sp. JCM 18896]|uniref:DUF4349 domain-containing protein n=1 Tax=Novosphingobium sp. JCM 18896 TaxID=2989731 RepID=UPI002221C1E9|nr:DUF4349 domain-containing protein [Novosphingobium sp. JCM 18896]MCW1427903.1 DUF4349 domain-containing protein [Novosphingobium sp. JCM 18896]